MGASRDSTTLLSPCDVVVVDLINSSLIQISGVAETVAINLILAVPPIGHEIALWVAQGVFGAQIGIRGLLTADRGSLSMKKGSGNHLCANFLTRGDWTGGYSHCTLRDDEILIRRMLRRDR